MTRLAKGARVTIVAAGSAFEGRTGTVREDRGGVLLPYGVRMDGAQTTLHGLIYCAAAELQVQS